MALIEIEQICGLRSGVEFWESYISDALFGGHIGSLTHESGVHRKRAKPGCDWLIEGIYNHETEGKHQGSDCR